MAALRIFLLLLQGAYVIVAVYWLPAVLSAFWLMTHYAWFIHNEVLTTELTAAPNVNHVKTALAIRTSKRLPGVPIAAD